MDVVMTGYAGLSGSAALAERAAEQLSCCLPGWLTDVPAGLLADEKNTTEPPSGLCRVLIGEGGLWEALWRLACEAEIVTGEKPVGLELNLADIPIRQETVEICEVLDEDPYAIPSGGWLVLAEDGWRLPGTVIGHTTCRKDRILHGREGVRYLNKPRRKEHTESTEEELYAK